MKGNLPDPPQEKGSPLGEQARLDFAKWILERNLGWIASAEIKVGVIVAINTAMLGWLASAFSNSKPALRSTTAIVATVLASGLSAASVFLAAMAFKPRTNGPGHSLIFSGPIAKAPSQEYLSNLESASSRDLLIDLADQIHRNAQIAVEKYEIVKYSMYTMLLALASWFVANCTLVQ